MAGDWLLGELCSGKSLGRQPRDWSLLNMLYFTLVILPSSSYFPFHMQSYWSCFLFFFFFFFFSFSLYSLLTLSQKSWQWAIWAGVVSARYHNLCKVMKGLTHRSYDQMKVTVSHLLIISVSISVHFRSISGKDFPLSFTYTAIHGRFITKSSQKWQ